MPPPTRTPSKRWLVALALIATLAIVFNLPTPGRPTAAPDQPSGTIDGPFASLLASSTDLGLAHPQRVQLTAALEVFDRLGAVPYAQIARAELRAAGVTAPTAGAVAGLDSLTAQERQIVSMAASGLTNPEIAAQLFISTHTVEWHLRKVFAKLGIKSRRQLRANG